MGANATGVAARVKESPDRFGAADRPHPAVTALLKRPVIVSITAITVLVAGIFGSLWSDHISMQGSLLANAASRLDIVASLAAHETRLIAGDETPTPDHLTTLVRALPPAALARDRVAYLSDAGGRIIASTPAPGQMRVKSLSDLFADDVPLQTGEDGGAAEAVLRDGTHVIVAIRELPGGHLTVIQPRSAAMDEAWVWSPRQTVLGLILAAGLVVLAVGCVRYRQRAHVADLICRRMTRRLDTSLTRGRCGLFEWDIARRRVSWSASMYELLGYDARDEHLSVGEVAALLHPEQASLRTLIEAAKSSEGPQRDLDLRVRTASGSWLWLRLKTEVVLDPVDGSRHVVGFATDVTDERGLAERRATADIRLRDAVEAISEAFVLWDADRRLVLCNSKFLKLYEVPPEIAALGTPSDRLLAAGRRPVSETVLTNVRHRDPLARTIEAQLPDGRWLHINERRTKDGGIVSVGTDVTALKRSEARLRERERRLQGSVREAETEKQRLAIVAERNIEANQAKTEFLARMSHELRTPLNAIIGFAEMMQNEILGPLGCRRYAEYTDDIHASGLKLLGVIDGILQMSRIERGQIRLVPELMTIGGAIDRAFSVLSATAAAKQIQVAIDLVEPGLLQADPDALQGVLLALLRNAVTFTRRGGSIRVRVRPTNGFLNVFVEDDGVGISADVLPRLGRPFEQVEAEYSRAGGGSGLGLAIARALTELHGGRLRIRSQPGVGTIVLVTLPVVQPAANDLGQDDLPLLRLVAAE